MRHKSRADKYANLTKLSTGEKAGLTVGAGVAIATVGMVAAAPLLMAAGPVIGIGGAAAVAVRAAKRKKGPSLG